MKKKHLVIRSVDNLIFSSYDYSLKHTNEWVNSVYEQNALCNISELGEFAAAFASLHISTLEQIQFIKNKIRFVYCRV